MRNDVNEVIGDSEYIAGFDGIIPVGNSYELVLVNDKTRHYVTRVIKMDE